MNSHTPIRVSNPFAISKASTSANKATVGKHSNFIAIVLGRFEVAKRQRSFKV